LKRRPIVHRKGEEGQAVLLVMVAASIFLIGAVGLAIDGAQLYAQRQMAQTAADAAAQAAALSIFHGTNATASTPFATTTRITCTSTTNPTPCAYAGFNGFVGGTAGDTVTVDFPTAVSGVSSLSAAAPAVLVTVQRTVNTTLLRFLGPSSSVIRATATAASIQSALQNCITTLDPSASASLQLRGNASLNLPTCGIAVDSNSTSALAVNGNVSVTADSIQVVGGVDTKGNVSLNPTPTTGVASVADPLGSVPAPTVHSPCNFTQAPITGNTTITLLPGTYCNGLSIGGNANVTFSPGTFVFLGGGLNASGNISLTGAGVTFYNTFDATHSYAPISVTGNFNANLSAPASGPLQGMLFFQDRNAPLGTTDSFKGNTDQTVTGAFYFPRSTLDYIGNSSAGAAQNAVIIADKVLLQGNASLRVDPTNPAAAHQLKVALIK
jgi:hypothetical protein